MFEGGLTLKRLITFGFFLQPWQTAPYVKNPAIGRFEGTMFDPADWKPRVPTAAFLRARADDSFWAARRVMAFSDEMIRAIVKTGQYTDPQAEQLLADVLIQRRDKIGSRVSERDQPGGQRRARRQRHADVRERRGRGRRRDGSGRRLRRPLGALRQQHGHGHRDRHVDSRRERPHAGPVAAGGAGAYIKVEIRAVQPAHPSWGVPLSAYFRRDGGWRLVGLERMP